MNNDEIIKALQKISNSKNQPELIEQFKKTYPNNLDWLGMFDKKNDNQFSYKGSAPKIEGFEVLKPLGSGASGKVFLAQQQETNRQVAIKVAIQYLSKQQLHRFQHESILLSSLSHPNIAKLFKSGIIDNEALPYIIMEYVDGKTIHRYCLDNNLNTKEIINLFNQVLDAIQYAHNKGIIHRDIKPENILVNKQGKIKLLDFGIALAIDNSTQQLTQLTKTGEIVGTLAYMSPEQVSGQDNLDTRTDIYSLGVVLYQLLSNCLPHNLDASQIFSAISQIIEDLPTKLTKQNKTIDADLATIVHHAMAKSPNDRYQSPRDFKVDLTNWQNGNSINVKNNTLWESIRYITNKHKALAVGSFLAILGLITGLVFAISFAIKEQDARRIAESNALTSKKTVEFINELFLSADPENLFGEKLTLLQVINNADIALVGQLKGEHVVEANIRLTIAGVYISLGQVEIAQKQVDRIKILYPSLKNNSNFGEIRFQLALIQSSIYKYRHNYSNDIDFLRNLLAKEELSKEKKVIVEIELAGSLLSDGKPDKAEQIIDKALKFLEYNHHKDDNYLLYALVSKAMILDKLGNFKDSKQIYESVISSRIKNYGYKHPKTLTALNNLSAVERNLGNREEAVKLLEQLITTKIEVLGKAHLSTLTSQSNILVILVEQKKFDEALEYSKPLIKELTDSLGPLHARTLEVGSMQAYIFEDLGKTIEAEKIYKDTLLQYEKAGTISGTGLLLLQNNLAMLLMKQSKFIESEGMFNQLLENVEKTLGKKHIYYAIFIGNYGELLLRTKAYKKARPLLEKSYIELHSIFGEENPRTIKAQKRLDNLGDK